MPWHRIGWSGTGSWKKQDKADCLQQEHMKAIGKNGKDGGILFQKRLLITGVLSPRSIAFAIAQAASAEGAEVILTSFGRAMTLTQKSAARISGKPDVLELDVTRPEQLTALASSLKERFGNIDGVVHAIGFAPEECLAGGFMTAPWESVATALQVSSYSLVSLSQAMRPLFPPDGGAIVALTFDASRAWPLYDWMGPAKAALESATRYLARDLGKEHIRVNSIAAGPLDTVAAKAIPGFASLRQLWARGAPLGWDAGDATPVADTATFLLSSRARDITGQIIHVDGGFSSQGAAV